MMTIAEAVRNGMNLLCYGDNLTVMGEMDDGIVDLIYLDPPFNSNRNYNSIYEDDTGNPLPDQVEAFCDTWQLNAGMREVLDDLSEIMLESGIDGSVVRFIESWLNNMGGVDPSMQSYLSYMAPRLLEMKRVLKSTGSIYLHCDPTASHHLKILMDCIFGQENFRNEIVWHHPKIGVATKKFTSNIDQIFFYSKSGEYLFNPLRHDQPNELYNRWKSKLRDDRLYYREAKKINDSPAKSKIRVLEKALGRPLTDDDVVVDFNDEANKKIIDNVWRISYLKGNSKEYLGYETQKPLALLKRVIEASSNKGDLVLDPFCGCATTMEAAHRHGCKWIGIDIAIHAIKRVAKRRLAEEMGLTENKDFEIRGIPRNFEGTFDLWKRDPYHFQKWAVEQVGGFVTTKRTADGGIDGRIWFRPAVGEELTSMIIEVKGGKNVNVGVLRELRGNVEKHKDALIAGLIVLHPLSAQQRNNFMEEVRHAGYIEVEGSRFAKLQILTVDEVLTGKQFDIPGRVVGKEVVQPSIPGMRTNTE